MIRNPHRLFRQLHPHRRPILIPLDQLLQIDRLIRRDHELGSSKEVHQEDQLARERLFGENDRLAVDLSSFGMGEEEERDEEELEGVDLEDVDDEDGNEEEGTKALPGSEVRAVRYRDRV
jgi:hypothetical protein